MLNPEYGFPSSIALSYFPERIAESTDYSRISDLMIEIKKSKLIPLILPICIIIFWYLITEGLGIVDPYRLPSPGVVWESAVRLILNGKLLENTLETDIIVEKGAHEYRGEHEYSGDEKDME